MDVKWTSKALSDVDRLHEFLVCANAQAAARAVQKLVAVPARLADNPRIGEKLQEFEPREVYRLMVGHYEIRYEIRGSVVYVLRIWHAREDR
jgi:plasmid stabilization system protein ParE